MFQKIGTMIFLSDFEATMEERKAMITRPALKEILHRDYEKCFKKVDGHYKWKVAA